MAGRSPPSDALSPRSSPPPLDPSTRSSPPPSDPSRGETEDDDKDLSVYGRTTGSGEVWKERLPYGDQTRMDDALMEQIVGIKIEKDRSGDSPNSKKRKHKDGAEQPGQVINNDIKVSKDLTRRSRKKGAIPSPRVTTRVTTSPGVTMIMMKATQKRGSMMVRPGSAKRAKMAGSPQQPAQHSHDSPPQQTPISPSLDDLSPPRSSHGRARKPRKLTSRIWKEVEPIYQGTILVAGRCLHCREVFPASRDSGSSHIGRHLKVCESKKAMKEMVDNMGPPEGIDPNWKFDMKLARRKLVKLIVVNELPFTFVEYKPFREFTASLNP